MRYKHLPIASLLIGAAQEDDLVSPGFEQSTVISNHSTLDFSLLYGEQRIVLPGGTSWKRLCSSSVPPDDDDDDACMLVHGLRLTSHSLNEDVMLCYVKSVYSDVYE